MEVGQVGEHVLDEKTQDPPDDTVCLECANRGVLSVLKGYYIDLELLIFLCPDPNCIYPFGTGMIDLFCVTCSSQIKTKEDDILKQIENVPLQQITPNCNSREEADIKDETDFYKTQLGHREYKKESYFVKTRTNNRGKKTCSHLVFK